MREQRLQVLLALATLSLFGGRMYAQVALHGDPLLEVCAEYSEAGELLKASVSAHAFAISVARPSGENTEINGNTTDAVLTSAPAKVIVPCQISIYPSSDRAALAVSTANGLVVQMFDLSNGQLEQSVQVPPKFKPQFSLHPVGFINQSGQLAVSQAHYLPTGEPEVFTQLVGVDGGISPDAHSVTGPRYSEISESSFDLRGSRVWFLCPVYSERVDRQPRCTLTFASLTKDASAALEIPPPPDDRVIGSGQPNLGFPTTDLTVLLAQGGLWLYSFSTRSFRQMNLPETPHHIRWFEFPGQPKFSADGRFAAVPVSMFHAPLFEEGEVSHGTKIVVVDLTTLQILKTIQPNKKEDLVDFALRDEGTNLTLVANWGEDWKITKLPIVQGH